MHQQLEADDEFDEADLDDESSARERWLKLALLTIAAGLAATIVGLLAQGDDDTSVDTDTETTTVDGGGDAEETGGAETTVEGAGNGDGATTSVATTADAGGETTAPETSSGDAIPTPAGLVGLPRSGTLTVDIDVLTETGGQAADLTSRFNGADYETTIAFLGDPDTYSGTPFVQDLRFAGGSYYYQSTEGTAWGPVDDPSVVSLNEGISLPASVVGWSTAGLNELVGALGVDPGASGPTSTTITVAEARGLPALPAGVATIVGDQWDWRNDQPIDITITITDGFVTELDATAFDDDPDRITGPLTVSARTTYAELDGEVAIVAP